MGVIQVPQNPFLTQYQKLIDFIKNWILSNYGLLRTRNHFHIPDRAQHQSNPFSKLRSRNSDNLMARSLDRPDVHRMHGKDQSFVQEINRENVGMIQSMIRSFKGSEDPSSSIDKTNPYKNLDKRIMKPYLRQEISTLFDCLEQDKLNFKVFTEKLSSLERFGTGPQSTLNAESHDMLRKTGIDQIVDRLKGERSQRDNKLDMKLSTIGKGSMREQMKAIKKKKMSDKLAKILNSQKSCADAYRINQILNLHSTEELGSAKCYQVKSPYDVQERHNTGRLSRLLYETETR